MGIRFTGRARQRAALALLWTVMLTGTAALSACADDPTETSDSATAGKPDWKLTVGLAYIPNIQFAPFYVADALHYYDEAEVKVTLRHHAQAEDEFGALKSGTEDVIYAGGDEMLQARTQAVPVVDVATLYRKYPVAVMVPADSPIKSPADLKGKKVGTPGPYGETYFGLLALLQGSGLKTSDVDVQNIGFTQQAALAGHKVDAVTGYLNNDAVQFEQAKVAVRSIAVADAVKPFPLVSNGIGARKEVLDTKGDAVRAFLAATLRAVQYTIDHPDEAVKIAKKYVPGLEDPQQSASALAVLKATEPLWKAGDQPMGQNDPETWRQMAEFMRANGLIKEPVDATAAFSNDYLPKGR